MNGKTLQSCPKDQAESGQESPESGTSQSLAGEQEGGPRSTGRTFMAAQSPACTAAAQELEEKEMIQVT